MNKKLLTLAVAAALATPAIASAEAIMYGRLHVSIDYADVTNAIAPVANFSPAGQGYPSIWARNGVYLGDVVPGVAGPVGASAVAPQQVGGGSDFTGWGMTNGYIPRNAPITGAGGGRASRLGMKGNEDLGNGLKAIYQIEFGIAVTDSNNDLDNNADNVTMRNTFVGLGGDWGSFLVGRHDTPLKMSTGKLDLFADSLADNNTTVGFNDIRADNIVAYISPSFSGFNFSAAVVPAGGSNMLGSQNTEADSINAGWSLGAVYSNGPFYGSLAYESLGYELFNSDANNFGCAVNAASCTTSDTDWTKWRVGLGLLDWNGFSLTGIYEKHNDIAGSDAYTSGIYDGSRWYLPGGPQEADLWQVQAGYSFGNSMIKAMYGAAEFTSDDVVARRGLTPLESTRLNDLYEGKRETWGIGFEQNFSKRTKAYALYTDVQDDRSNWIGGSEWSGFSLGMIHNF